MNRPTQAARKLTAQQALPAPCYQHRRDGTGAKQSQQSAVVQSPKAVSPVAQVVPVVPRPAPGRLPGQYCPGEIPERLRVKPDGGRD
jgi:hypothetical protein